MGDWIHCNVCIRMPTQGNEQYPFYFTSCGHIICGKCYETAPESHCMRCSKRANAVKINRNLRSDLQMYFRNPKELLEQYVKNLNAVLDFQSGHRQHLQKAKQEQAAEESNEVRNIGTARNEAEDRKGKSDILFLAGGSLASTERSGGGSSGRFATSTPISDCLETDGFKLAADNRSLSRVAAAFSRSGIEPSPIALSTAIITTPDMLGLRKRSEKLEKNWLNGKGTTPNRIFS
uniref:Bm3025 n=1 Tax=Brugia malayi TaxID=6279 RepID=A0A1I9GAK2_BRUMA|nr:Bm3025 [Brugia malayi]